jgi:DNA-binding response OmpR family regulator
MLHVLLVEDNPADALMVREAIQTSPVTVDLMIAYDGEQALRFIIEFRFEPDIVVLDLNVPKLDSFKFLEHLGANQTPVIVLTGSVNPTDQQRAVQLGAKEYLAKPIDIDEFTNVVREAVTRWGGQAVARGL